MGLIIPMTKRPSTLKSNKQRAYEQQQAAYEAQMAQGEYDGSVQQ